MVKQCKQWQTFFSCAPKLLQIITAAIIRRHLLLGRKAMTNLDSIVKGRDIPDKDQFNQSYGLSSSHVWIWELEYKESWAPKNWWFCTVVLEKTLESPLEYKEIKPVNPKGNQSWIFIGRTDAEAPILWTPDEKSWLIRKDPDSGKDWRQGEKGTIEDELVGWHHRFNGHEFEQASGDGEGQECLACCSPWGHEESNMTERLNKAFNSKRDFKLIYQCKLVL